MKPDEQLIAIVSFNGALKREIMRVKKQLERCESLAAFKLNITASGRTAGGDTSILYSLGGEYGENSVEGPDFTSVLDEFLRRHNWKKEHAPLMLTEGEQRQADDEILF